MPPKRRKSEMVYIGPHKRAHKSPGPIMAALKLHWRRVCKHAGPALGPVLENGLSHLRPTYAPLTPHLRQSRNQVLGRGRRDVARRAFARIPNAPLTIFLVCSPPSVTPRVIQDQPHACTKRDMFSLGFRSLLRKNTAFPQVLEASGANTNVSFGFCSFLRLGSPSWGPNKTPNPWAH